MSSQHTFGGSWTEEKLERVQRYMVEYMKIFSRNVYARSYVTNYVDAFAGTGSRSARRAETGTLALFDEQDLADMQAFYRGSTRRALEVEPPFGRYLFIEQNPEFVAELERLRAEYPHLSHRITIRQGDANLLLREWCRSTDWGSNRALVFLDPYGMSVDWSTIQTLAHTEAVDLWILLPVGSAINRLLPRQGPPTGAWADSLTRIFGTDAWKSAFYRPSPQMSFLEDLDPGYEKVADFHGIGEFFVERLKTEFVGVAEDFLMLYNSKNNPIFMLFFAASNKRGAPTALKIAGYILRK